jgi:YidC/Oxa1 family membrane protein insertase
VILVASIITPLENALRAVLDWLHTSVGLPWAWSIVALTVIVRMLLVPLTVRQIHSMQNLQRHAPQMKEIQKKYKGDRQKMNEELMKFYRENQINPAASCIPMLAQIPVFLALYFVLNTFAKQADKGEIAGDLHWLGLWDITAKATEGWGPLLLVVYVASQFFSTLLMSSTMDKTQRTIMLGLPFVLVFVVLNFRIGLILYWMTTNLWTVGQGIVTRRLVPKGPVLPPPAPKRSSRTPPKEQPPDDGNGATTEEPVSPTPAPVARSTGPPRKVRRKKKGGARR